MRTKSITILAILLACALLPLTACSDDNIVASSFVPNEPQSSQEAPPQQEPAGYVKRYPGEYNTSLSDYSNIEVLDEAGNDISPVAIDLWYCANEIYNVDDMLMFEMGEYEAELTEYMMPFSNQLLNYHDIIGTVFTENAITQLEQTAIGGPDPLIRKTDSKVYRMAAWKTGYSFAKALTDMQVKEYAGDKIALAVTYAQMDFDSNIHGYGTADFTIAYADGVWLVDDYVNPEANTFYSDAGFLEEAYALGYTIKQLEYLQNSEIPKDRILNLSVSENEGLASPNGRYLLGSYEVNMVVSCMFLYDTETSQATVLPDWQNGYSQFDFLSEEQFYASVGQAGGADYEAGVRFYNVTSPREPYALWNLTDSTKESEKIRILLGTYKIDGADLLLSFWCETPVEWGGWVQDDTETYQITLIDYDGNVAKEFDAGISLGSSKTGIAAPGFEKANMSRTPMPDIIYFDIGDISYQCDYRNGTVSVI